MTNIEIAFFFGPLAFFVFGMGVFVIHKLTPRPFERPDAAWQKDARPIYGPKISAK